MHSYWFRVHSDRDYGLERIEGRLDRFRINSNGGQEMVVKQEIEKDRAIWTRYKNRYTE